MSWTLFALAAAIVTGAAAHAYLRLEPGVRGRRVLLGLRTLALVLLLLLLFNPRIPSSGALAGGHRVVLLDGSLSMTLPARPGSAESRWDRAVAVARSEAGSRPFIVFGERVRTVDRAGLDDLEPSDRRTLLAPALAAAAEAGAGSVLIVTDAGVEDAGTAERAAARYGLRVDVERVGEPLRNRGLSAVEAPRWASDGEAITLAAVIAGDAGDAGLEVRSGGDVLARSGVRLEADGDVVLDSIPLRVRAPAGGGWVRLDVALVAPSRDEAAVRPLDDVRDDDARSVYVYVSSEPPGPVVVSLTPGWEPRFLLPVLEDAVGLPARGYLAVGEDRFVAIGTGHEAGRPVPESAVRAAAGAADLLVIDGWAPGARAWIEGAMEAAAGLILLPAAAGAVPGIGALGDRLAGDWYAFDPPPASPLAAVLSDLALEDLPPLAGVRAGQVEGHAWPVLMGRAGRAGAERPLVLIGESGPRRWAVGSAEGYWRWAFRPDAPRQAYRHLWSSVAGWILARDGTTGPDVAFPRRRSLQRGEPLTWSVAGGVDSLRIRWNSGNQLALEEVTVAVRGDSAVVPAPGPGHHSYVVTAYGGSSDGDTASGPITVESYSDELSRPGSQLEGGTPLAVGGASPAAGDGRPLHSSGWPFLLVVGLLCSEWILRRRWGLR